jgi:hypothetical protein
VLDEVSAGNGTTWLTMTPLPSGLSSAASALAPTKEIFTNSGVKSILRASLMNSAHGLYGPTMTMTMTTASGSARLSVSSADFTAMVLRSKVPSGASSILRFFSAALMPSRPERPNASSWYRMAEILGQMPNPVFGLGPITGPDIDDVFQLGIAQEAGARDAGYDSRGAEFFLVQSIRGYLSCVTWRNTL